MLKTESPRMVGFKSSFPEEFLRCFSIRSPPSDSTDSILDESSGISPESRRARRISAVRGSTQKVSRFHNLQLRFSSRRPSSMTSAHLEKTIHIPCRLSAFLVSTSCIFAGSTARTGVLSRTGIVTRTKGVLSRSLISLHRTAPFPRADDLLRTG